MKRNILGVEIDDISIQTVLDQITHCITKRKRCFVVTPNPEIILESISNEHYHAILNSADISLPDGVGLKVASRILGIPLKNRVTGIDTAFALLEKSQKKGFTIYLLGGKKGVCEKAKMHLETKFPNLQIVGCHQGGDITQEGIGTMDTEVIQDIESKKPDILLVAFGAPKQEYWIKRHLSKLSQVHVMMGIGGSFDIFANKLKRAPQWMRFIGIEWMYRVFQEPRRLKRIYNAVIIFPFTAIIWKFRSHFMFRPNAVGFIINKQKEVLIVRRKGWDNHWQIPQGGIDFFEPLTQGARREVFEETGLKNLQLIGKKKRFHKYLWEPWHRLNRGFKGQKQHLFIFKHVGKNEDVVIDEFEIDAYKWVPIDRLLHQVHPIRRSMAQKAMQHYEQLVT